MAAEWNDRLLSRGRALELIGDWPIRLAFDETTARLSVRCARDSCGQSCGDFTVGLSSPADMLAAVMRHAVTAHDLALSGRGPHG